MFRKKVMVKYLSGILAIALLFNVFVPGLSTVAADEDVTQSQTQDITQSQTQEIADEEREIPQSQKTEIQSSDSTLSQIEEPQTIEPDITYNTNEYIEESGIHLDDEVTASDTSVSEDAANLLEDKTSDDSSEVARDLTSTDDMYLYTDVSFTISDGQEQAVYTVDVNKGRENLSRYDLGASFLGNTSGITGIKVYRLDTSGYWSTALIEGVDYDYDTSTGVVSFGTISDCYEIVYSVNISGSVAAADMNSPGSAVEIEGTFVASLANSDGSDDAVLSETKTFQPITADSANSGLKNASIITGYTTEITGATEVKVTLDWSLSKGLVDGEGNPITMEANAGYYYVFKIDSDLIEINNACEGILSRDFDSSHVGDFYLYPDGIVVFVFNRFTEEHDNIYGQFSITSGYTGQEGDEIIIDVEVNGETLLPEPEKDEYTIEKSGELKPDGGTIIWGITVNPERISLKDVIISDSKDSYWGFNGDINVYTVDEYDEKTLYTDYTSQLSNGKWTIELGDISEEILIELPAETTGTTTANSRTYYNTVYSNAEGYDLLIASASVTKTFAAVSKSAVNTINADGTTTVDWLITFNANNKILDVSEIELIDTISDPYWYNADGAWLESIVYDALQVSDITLMIGSATLVEGTDYEINFDTKTFGQTKFTITFKDSVNVTGETGYLSNKVTISYSIRIHTETMPDGAAGWKFVNRIATNEDRYVSAANTTTSLRKTNSNHDHTAQTVDWTITANDAKFTLPSGFILYDLLPDGFTVLRETLKVNASGNGNIKVVDDYNEAISQELTEFFVYSDAAVNTTVGSSNTVVQYDDGRGFSLTYYNLADEDTKETFTVRFKTSYNYDPKELGEGNSDYVQSLINTNVSILYHEDWSGFYRAASTVTIPNRLIDGGSKSGRFLPGITDEDTGNCGSSSIQWTAYANIMNKDLEGSVFEDAMLNGQTSSSSGVGIETSEQTITIDDVKVYPYSITNTDNRIINTDVITEYLKTNEYLTVENNTVKITFPTGNDYDDYLSYLKDKGITTSLGEANLRFVVVMTSTLKGSIAPYYPNTATLTFGDGDKYDLDAHVSIDIAANPITKSGTIISSDMVSYSVVLNKDQNIISDLVITDRLMYSDDGLQLLYLGDNSDTLTGYDLRIYYAIISLDGNGKPVYTKGEEITTYGDGVNAYSLVYDTASIDPDDQGFQVVFDEDFTLNGQPIIMEYSAYLRDDYFQYGSRITNTVSYTGRDDFASGWTDTWRYTIADGSSTGEVVSFSLQKVDNDGNALTGAYFSLYSESKKYRLRDAFVDESGILEFNDITIGTYYLVENPPEGYESRHDLLSNAMEIVVTAVYNEDGTTEAVIYGRIDGVLKIISENGIFEVENERVTGSISLKKYQNDENGKETEYTLAGAEFILYKLAEDNTKLYYTNADANGTLKFEDDYEKAVRLITNESGFMEQDGIPGGEYYLEEVSAPLGYEILSGAIEITIPAQADYELVLYDDLTLIEIGGTKTWENDEGCEYLRPNSITVNLYRNDEEEPAATQNVTPAANGSWTYSFKDLPMCDHEGVEYEYRVIENDVKGYITAYEITDRGYDITNTLKTVDISGIKTWDDTGYESKRPDSIKINLFRNEGNELVEAKTVTAGSDGSWTYFFKNLPKYDKDGKEFVYTITEEEVDGYSSTINGYNVENKYTPTTISNDTPTTDTTANNSVSTGDISNIGILALLFLFSTGIIISVILIKRHGRKK